MPEERPQPEPVVRPPVERTRVKRGAALQLTARDVIAVKKTRAELPERFQAIQEYHEVNAAAQYVTNSLVQYGRELVSGIYDDTTAALREVGTSMHETNDHMANLRLTKDQLRILDDGFYHLDQQHVDALLDLADGGADMITKIALGDPLEYRRQQKQRFFDWLGKR